ncbi:hypothetical protein J3F84DRAFT_347980 [Trichoderma pleuroticola]
MAVLSRVMLAAAAATALGVSAATVTLNFDDIAVSNVRQCGQTALSQRTPYNGFFITGGGGVGILNSTATPNCPVEEETRPYSSWSTSGSNVVYNGNGKLKFTAQGPQKIIKSSFDVDLIFYDSELLLNTTVEIQTTLSGGEQELYVFHTLEDGFGPYHIETTGAPATSVLIEALAIEPIGEGPTINTDLAVDTVVFELE